MLQGRTSCFHLAVALTMAGSVARLATSLGIVPRATVVEEEEAATEVEDMVEEDTEEVQAVEEAEVCPPSSLEGLPRSLFALLPFDAKSPVDLGQTCYSCGGYGHMSRDCTQGQKCYNCMSNPHFLASFSSD